MAAVNMTEGNITKHLVRYSVPLILGNLFQLTYNAVDSIIAGRSGHEHCHPGHFRYLYGCFRADE